MHSREKVPIIAFDGNHRSGKGMQLAHFSRLLAQKGYDPLVLRGDGTRTGLGQERGDPVSLWWQQFKQFESAHPNLYEAWRIGARTLLAEAAIWYGNMPQNGVILFDRSAVSRAQMTLKEDMKVDAETMYGLSSDTLLSPEQLELLAPDVTFFLSAPPEKVLSPNCTSNGFVGGILYSNAALVVQLSFLQHSPFTHEVTPPMLTAAQSLR
jgi:thymidylate kinase